MTKQAPPTPMLPKIEQPDGYKVRTQWGLLRSDGTDAGRLVRLADLVQWLMDTQELPCGAAVERVCSVLDGGAGAGVALFMLDVGGYAKPLGGGQDFGFHPITIGGSGYLTRPDPALFGATGAIRCMRRYWVTEPVCASAYEAVGLECLAVPLRLAFDAWGWGRFVAPAGEVLSLVPAPAAVAEVFPLKDFDALVVYRKMNPGVSWVLGNQLAIALAEFERRKATGLGKVAVLNVMHEEMGGRAGAGRTVLEKALFGDRSRNPAAVLPKAGTGGAAIKVRSGKRA